MKLSLLFGIAALFVATSASATDTVYENYVGDMVPTSKHFQRVDLDSGKSMVDVELFDPELKPAPNMKLSCRFFDPYGNVASEQKNVMACRVNTNVLTLPSHLNIEITNDNPNRATFEVRVFHR